MGPSDSALALAVVVGWCYRSMSTPTRIDRQWQTRREAGTQSHGPHAGGRAVRSSSVRHPLRLRGRRAETGGPRLRSDGPCSRFETKPARIANGQRCDPFSR